MSVRQILLDELGKVICGDLNMLKGGGGLNILKGGVLGLLVAPRGPMRGAGEGDGSGGGRRTRC
jgi:hypothetical protein